MRTLGKQHSSSLNNNLKHISRRDHVSNTTTKPVRKGLDYICLAKLSSSSALDEQISVPGPPSPSLTITPTVSPILELMNILDDYGKYLSANNSISAYEGVSISAQKPVTITDRSTLNNENLDIKTQKMNKESQTDCSMFDLLYFSFNFGFSKGTQTDENILEN